MSTIRKNHSNSFKFKVVLDAIAGKKTMADLCNEYCVASSQIYAWKKQFEERGPAVFEDKRSSESNNSNEIDKLHRIIGELTVERDFLSRVLKR